MALWMDWHLTSDPEDIVSGGPRSQVIVGDQIEWDLHSRQGVHFFQGDHLGPRRRVRSVEVDVVFKPEEGDFVFHFERKFRT